jgi:hypothetical protein
MDQYELTLVNVINHVIEKHPEISDFISNKLQLTQFENQLSQWQSQGFSMPCPPIVKQSVLQRNGFSNSVWIETGTYLGDTTLFLSKISNFVHSIEPENKLFLNAQIRFKDFENVNLIHGSSEDVFPDLLSKINGNVNFWLDGHYSAGITYKGKNDTPIKEELISISQFINNFEKICVCIDDIRCFDPSNPDYATYPEVDFLIEFAKDNNLKWHIEHDIFIAKSSE